MDFRSFFRRIGRANEAIGDRLDPLDAVGRWF